MTSPNDELDLADYRRRVHELYREVRRASPGSAAWTAWRAGRDELFVTHPQSALAKADRRAFGGLRYFPYDPAWRFAVVVEPVEPDDVAVGHSGAGQTHFRRFGRVRLPMPGEPELSLYWLAGYGGGIFLPFRDATAGRETYGGGRYLLDTVKGADLGDADGRMVLDFNYAYHPSCVYSDRWSCPLAPRENHMGTRVEAGERLA